MNVDERTPGQQQHSSTDPQNTAAQGGSMSTGQASYGNSGEGSPDASGENKSSHGQNEALGETGRDTDLSSTSDSDTGSSSAGTGRSGIDGSMDSDQSTRNAAGSTGRSGIEGSLDSSAQSGFTPSMGQQDSSEQGFANQGQGAPDQATMSTDRQSGTHDIEMERSQGRENDIEGSSL